MYITWNHIADIFYEDRECGLHTLTKLLYEHIKLTPYSIMNVKLAAQVLSSTVSKTLTSYGPPETVGTAKLCLLMDSFFDVMNIRNIQSHEFKRKPFLAPFTSVNDDRFGWLQNILLKYFEDWLTFIEQRPGNFSRNARMNMFLSWQTFEGLNITVHSIIEAVMFLLQRAIGARKDNPSIRDFGFNDNSIRNQKIFGPTAGNVCRQDIGMINFTNDALPCRKKPKKY